MEALRYGSRGNGVLLLQLALRREGSYKGKPDGIFGTRTLNAVRRFQSSAGLIPDGAAGPKTRAAAEPYILGYVTHRLRPGDTFYRLAKRYGVTAEATAAANPKLDPARLPVGEEITIPLPKRVVPTDVPYSSELLGYVVRGLTARYPFIKAEEMGRSASNRPLWALKTGAGKRTLFINAAHHANEWITAPLVLDFLETYAEAYMKRGTLFGRSAAALFTETRLIIAPMVDPDGVDLVNGAADAEEYGRALGIAEGFPDIPFPSGWKANILGTDLNLNYPADWEKAKEIKFAQGFTRPAPRDYVGASPLSAPEAAAMYAYTRAQDPDITISYHTQGGEIYWRYGDIEPEGAFNIAEAMAAVSGYRAADVPEGSSCAGYRDWFIMEYGRPGFTVEAGEGVNPLPLSLYPRLREDDLPLMAAALEAVTKGS
ncbi:MAG: peptidoglycan-binding protein [Clostridia bacterium]|nr:peptidoglycan-binding protein [Clostridia bacterium]